MVVVSSFSRAVCVFGTVAPADFSLGLFGRTGVGKSELAALAQQHYGPGMDARADRPPSGSGLDDSMSAWPS